MPERYVAKVADFGYSTCVEFGKGISDDQRISLPWSPPWNAPEVCRESPGFTYSEAKATDSFSLGLVCLWVLFIQPMFSTGGSQNGQDQLYSMKQAGTLKYLAQTNVDSQQDMDSSTKVALRQFFNSTLSREPSDRDCDLHHLLTLLTQDTDDSKAFHIPTITGTEIRFDEIMPSFKVWSLGSGL